MKRLIAIALLVGLAGCDNIPWPPEPTPPPPSPTPSPTPTPTPEPTPTPTPEPTPTPTPAACPFNTPTAAWMAARGKRVEVAPRREGRKAWGATPLGWDWPEVNGQPYYCQRGLWPERCREGRNDGPVAPDGHPYRVACERQFLQLDCPYFTLESDEHMSYDPYVCINESGLVVEDLSPEACVNQNHPRNVEVCGQTKFGGDPSWVKEEHLGHLYVVAGEWSWATAHGNGKVCASAKDGVAKKCVKYTEP